MVALLNRDGRGSSILRRTFLEAEVLRAICH